MKLKFEFEIDLSADNVPLAKSVITNFVSAIEAVPSNGVVIPPQAPKAESNVVELRPAEVGKVEEKPAAVKPAKKEKVVKDIDTSEVLPSADVEVPAAEVSAPVEGTGEIPEDEAKLRDEVKELFMDIMKISPAKNAGLVDILTNKLGAEKLGTIPADKLVIAKAEFEALRDSK